MYKQTKLLNNAKLITIPMAGTKTVTVLIMVKTGSKYENGNLCFVVHKKIKSPSCSDCSESGRAVLTD
ncbi:hypothetical protein KKB73_00330 [Patescibacteria group bacterium]|nr:hypothetical protein [Patescibacteria group bacterium]